MSYWHYNSADKIFLHNSKYEDSWNNYFKEGLLVIVMRFQMSLTHSDIFDNLFLKKWKVVVYPLKENIPIKP